MARTRTHLFAVSLAVFAAWLAAMRPAGADDARADAARRFKAGSEAYARGDFPSAARAFDEAYRIAPRAAVAYNAGLSWESAGQRSRAADDYTRALEGSDLGAVERADATGRLRALERALARLTLSAPGATRLALDDVELPSANTVAHVEPGKHAVRATYPDGHEASRALVARAGVPEVVSIGDVQQDHAAKPSAPDDGAKLHPSDHEEAPPAPEPDRLPAWIAFGGAGAASIVAVAMYEVGASARNDFVNGGSTDASLHDKASTLRTATWVSWGIAGALGVTGLVLYLVPPSRGAAIRGAADAAVSVDGRGVALRVTF
jgi:hypothetical protein